MFLVCSRGVDPLSLCLFLFSFFLVGFVVVVFVCLFVCLFVCFKTGFLSIALAVLELTL